MGSEKKKAAKKQTWKAGNMLYPVPAVMEIGRALCRERV